ncbi:MAG: dipeptidase PepV [Eubacteriales bacterium]|nr:dipeptidase PepV [Eubacteriales bacterium]
MDYLEFIKQYKDEFIETLQSLISIRSVAEKPQDSEKEGLMPFGKGVHDAFKYMLGKAAADGFLIKNVDNYGGHIQFGEGEKIMGVLGHLDVVPEGEGWAFPPYEGVVIEGKMYGRGTADDKGPIVAAYYAMKALKDSGFKPAARVRLILGLDEETNWHGMRYYLDKEEAPDFGFTPDAEFPAINGEKGIITFQLAKKLGKSEPGGLEIRSLDGGNASNMVADWARAVLRSDESKIYDSIRDAATKYREENINESAAALKVKGIGKSLEITTKGLSAHGATPEKGINAIAIMMDFLGRLNFANDDINEFIDFYNKHIGFETTGKSLGCGFSDKPSANLSLNVGKISADKDASSLTLNVRYPVTFESEKVYDAIAETTAPYDIGIVKEKYQAPIYIPEDDVLIKTLQEVYCDRTGDTSSNPIVIGGGTYARACKGIVAYGAIFPGEPEVAHQTNEYIEIDKMLEAAAIYAEAIYRLTKDDHENIM